jgi:hypothetical protein
LDSELAGSQHIVGSGRGSAWPIQGGLASISGTPVSHPPQQRTNPARNAFSDHLPHKTNMQITQAADTINRSKTPSPQKMMVKVENISPAGVYKEEVKVAQINV